MDRAEEPTLVFPHLIEKPGIPTEQEEAEEFEPEPLAATPPYTPDFLRQVLELPHESRPPHEILHAAQESALAAFVAREQEKWPQVSEEREVPYHQKQMDGFFATESKIKKLLRLGQRQQALGKLERTLRSHYKDQARDKALEIIERWEKSGSLLFWSFAPSKEFKTQLDYSAITDKKKKVLESLQSLQDPAVALQRMEALFGKSWGEWKLRFGDESVPLLLKQIEVIDEESIQTLLAQIQDLPHITVDAFDYNHTGDSPLSTDALHLVEALQQGGFSESQFASLKKYEEVLSYTRETHSLTTALSNLADVENQLQFLEEVILSSDSPRPFEYGNVYPIHSWEVKSAFEVYRRTLTSSQKQRLKDIFSQGIGLGPRAEKDIQTEARSPNPAFSQYLDGLIDNAARISQKPDFEQMLVLAQKNNEFLDLDNIVYYEELSEFLPTLITRVAQASEEERSDIIWSIEKQQNGLRSDKAPIVMREFLENLPADRYRAALQILLPLVKLLALHDFSDDGSVSFNPQVIRIALDNGLVSQELTELLPENDRVFYTFINGLPNWNMRGFFINKREMFTNLLQKEYQPTEAEIREVRQLYEYQQYDADTFLHYLSEKEQTVYRYLLDQPDLSRTTKLYFSQFIDEVAELIRAENGIPRQPDLDFIRSLYMDNTLTDERFIHFLPPEEQEIFRFFLNSRLPGDMKRLLLSQKDRFREFVKDDAFTTEFFKILLRENQGQFISRINKEQFIEVFGNDAAEAFLSALPKRTQERRNAFTHNDYDRTSAFLKHLIHYRATSDIQLDSSELFILADYVNNFGLSRSAQIYNIFKHLSLLEEGKIDTLPEHIAETGLRTRRELVESVQKVQNALLDTQPLLDLTRFSQFELELMSVATGKSSHSFDDGRQSFSNIVQDFSQDQENGRIAPTPPEYHPDSITLKNVTIEFDAQVIEKEYKTLSREILEALNNPELMAKLKKIFQQHFKEKQTQLEQNLQGKNEKAQAFIQKKIGELSSVLAAIESLKGYDDVLLFFLKSSFEKSDYEVLNSCIRQAILARMFEVHLSPAFIENVKNNLEETPSPNGLLTIINVVNEMVKRHTINVKNVNIQNILKIGEAKEIEALVRDESFDLGSLLEKSGIEIHKYWNRSVVAEMLLSKKSQQLQESFNPEISKLKETVDQLKTTETEGEQIVQIIPDRGFVGEMSAYIANVCYSKEYPLLAPRPELVPYKFVKGQDGNKELIGSVLMFEVQDSEGNPCLLVRAFDVPQETGLDVSQFIEQFLDKMAAVGKARGKKKILVPGLTGAISNYQISIHHITSQYKHESNRTSLAVPFTFNHYDLTENCYVARTIE